MSELIEQIIDEGYSPGLPGWGVIDGAGIDAGICAESECSECGHVGLGYCSFVKPEERSYRAVSVCPECGNEEEF